jgi:hypothetical protein
MSQQRPENYVEKPDESEDNIMTLKVREHLTFLEISLQ